MQQLLKGYKVLDFGRYIAAPYCASLLGQMGAEVIRIERPGGSEDRFLAPITPAGDGAMYMQMNAHKKGITLDIAKPEGRTIAKELIATADIVIANLPPKTLSYLGLDYESLTAVKEDVILVANTAFGSTGTYANYIGFDGMAQAITGGNFYSGFPDQPIRCTVNFVDFSTALSATLGTLAAIMHKERTGEGQIVETSLLSTALNLNNSMLLEQDALNINRPPKGNLGQLAGPADIFKTKDGHVVISVVGPYMFKRWIRLMNKPEWLTDERFKDDTERGKNNAFLSGEMSKWCRAKTTEEVLLLLKEAKLPAGPVLSFQQALDNPMVQSINHLMPLPFPGSPKDPLVAPAPFKLSKTPLEKLRRAPLLGEHNAEVYGGLGYSDGQLEELKSKEII